MCHYQKDFIKGMVAGVAISSVICMVISTCLPYNKKAAKHMGRKARRAMDNMAEKITVCRK